MSDSSAAEIFGELFEWLCGQSGGPPKDMDADEWLNGCRIPGDELRDKLRDLAMQYDFAWSQMGMSYSQMKWLGLPYDEAEEAEAKAKLVELNKRRENRE